jgi:hypothetical protein
MNKQLLIDTIPFELSPQVLNEALEGVKDGKPFLVKGILQRAESKNQNGRVYPRSTLEREAQKYNEEFVKERRALGELDHPNSEVVNLKNASHNIIELHWDGNDLIGTLEVLSTPVGNILKELFRSNIRVGISSRGLGTIKKLSENTDQVQDDYSLVSFDICSNPSTRGAFLFPQEALTEGIILNPLTNKWEQVENIIQDIFTEMN